MYVCHGCATTYASIIYKKMSLKKNLLALHEATNTPMVEPCQIHTMTYAEHTLPSLRSQSTSHQRQALTFDVIRSPTLCHKTLDRS
jgi:hypothetical protein